MTSFIWISTVRTSLFESTYKYRYVNVVVPHRNPAVKYAKLVIYKRFARKRDQ